MIKIALKNNKTIIRHDKKFNSPIDLDNYLESKNNDQKLIKAFEEEIKNLEDKTKSGTANKRSLYRVLKNIIVRLHERNIIALDERIYQLNLAISHLQER